MRKTVVSGPVFLVVMLLFTSGGYAQDSKLVQEYMDALRPKAAPQYPKGSFTAKGLGGVSEEAPSAIMHLPFKRDSLDLLPDAIKYLNALGIALQSQDLKRYGYRIEGHTCNLGTDAYNMELSKKRAEAVATYLTDIFGFPREQFETMGYGKSRPLVTNVTEEGKEQNRRVMVVNTLKELMPQQVDKPELIVSVKSQRGKFQKQLKDRDTLTSRDSYSVEFAPKTHAFVYVYQIDSTGKIDTLFPNSRFSNAGNPVETGRIYRIPEFNQWFYLDDNKGEEHIIVVAHKEPLKDPMKVCRELFNGKRTSLYASSAVSRGLGGKREPDAGSLAQNPIELPVPDNESPEKPETPFAQTPQNVEEPVAQTSVNTDTPYSSQDPKAPEETGALTAVNDSKETASQQTAQASDPEEKQPDAAVDLAVEQMPSEEQRKDDTAAVPTQTASEAAVPDRSEQVAGQQMPGEQGNVSESPVDLSSIYTWKLSFMHQ